MLICQAICKADARGNGVRLETGPGLLGTGVFSYWNFIVLFRKVNHVVLAVTVPVGLLELYFQSLDFPLEIIHTVMMLRLGLIKFLAHEGTWFIVNPKDTKPAANCGAFQTFFSFKFTVVLKRHIYSSR